MKIIAKDNFDRESVADSLVADNIECETYAKCMCDALRDNFSNEYGGSWFEVVPDDYKLWRGMEELI